MIFIKLKNEEVYLSAFHGKDKATFSKSSVEALEFASKKPARFVKKALKGLGLKLEIVTH